MDGDGITTDEKVCDTIGVWLGIGAPTTVVGITTTVVGETSTVSEIEIESGDTAAAADDDSESKYIRRYLM